MKKRGLQKDFPIHKNEFYQIWKNHLKRTLLPIGRRLIVYMLVFFFFAAAGQQGAAQNAVDTEDFTEFMGVGYLSRLL